MQRSKFHTSRGRQFHSETPNRLAVRIKNALLVLLALALIVSLIIGLPAIRYRSDARAYMLSRMEVECGDAQYVLTKISNTGGSSTYAQLARIRSEVYAVQILNQTYAALEGSGGVLVDEAVFTNLFTLIDNYYNHLITSATNTSIVLTDLDAALSDLMARLSAAH